MTGNTFACALKSSLFMLWQFETSMFQDFANRILIRKLFQRPTSLHNQGQGSSDHPLLQKLAAARLRR